MNLENKTLRQLIRNVLRTLKEIREREINFDGKLILSMYFFSGQQDQLIFKQPRTRQYLVGNSMGLEFRYSLQDSWNNNGAFCSFMIYELPNPMNLLKKPRVICSVSYIFHTIRGVSEQISFGSRNEHESTKFIDARHFKVVLHEVVSIINSISKSMKVVSL
jgi:hypothetical protein